MLKIGIYYRKSTDDNKRQKASIEDQKMWAHEYLKTLKVPHEIVAEYEEKKSAKAPWRPIFNEMMGQIYAGKIDTILVWAIDRLSRNEIDEWAIKWAVREWKLKEIHTKDSVYTETELFTMGIFLSMSAEEIATMRTRVMRRMRNMVEKEGKVPFYAPLGYKNTGNGEVEINDSEAMIVKKIFELRVAGLSFQQIADELNNRRLPTRRKNYHTGSDSKWNKWQIEHIIKNEFYIGTIKFMNTIGEGIFEKIISRDIWEQANNKKRMNIGYKHQEFTLKGIVVWPDGTPLTASKIKGKYVYYHTTWWKIKISENEIFKKMEKVVENWKLPDDIVNMLQKYIQDTMMGEYKAIIEEKMIHEKELKTLESREFNLAKFFTEGKFSSEMYEMQLAEIKKQRYQATENLQKLSALGLADLDKFEKIIELASNLLVAYKKADNELKGVIIRNAIIELQIDEQKSLKIKEKEPFYWLSIMNVKYGWGTRIRT